MEFEYNGNLNYMDRVKLVSNEIIRQYPEIEVESAMLAASLEDLITTNPTNEMKFKRLYNILFAVQNNKSIFNHVLIDIKNIYDLGYNSNLVESMMNELIRFIVHDRIDFPVMSEFV